MQQQKSSTCGVLLMINKVITLLFDFVTSFSPLDQFQLEEPLWKLDILLVLPYLHTLSIICSGISCAWVVRRRSDNPFRDINFSSHPSLARKSFIWPLLATFSSAYILAFFWISFRDTRKFFDLYKVIHSKTISSKSISLIFLPPPFSFFVKLSQYFEVTLFCILLSFCIFFLILFLSTPNFRPVDDIFTCFTTSSL